MFIRSCKIVFNQKIFSVLNKNSCVLNSCKKMCQIAGQNIISDANVSQGMYSFSSEDKQYCRNFLENDTNGPIQWGNLEQNLRLMKSENFRSIILRACGVLQKADLAIDYCHYIINKGEKLSIIETCLLIKVLAKSKIDLKNHEKFIETIYNHSRDTIFSIELTIREAIDVFGQIESCSKELFVKYKKGKMHIAGVENLIAVAFDLNKPELAWEIANENPGKFSQLGVESYLRFCIRLAEQNKFSTAMIDTLIDFSKTHSLVLKCNDFYNCVAQLTTILNKNESGNYLWSIDKCDAVNKDLCTSCQYKFQPVIITEEELKELKKNFLKKVMISFNMNMKTTPEELKNFFIYLENCKPYDIVIDALNVVGGTHSKKEFIRNVLSFFERQNMRILLIGKIHLQNYKFFNEIKRHCQIFLTRNDSLDDVFCLYATMHGGLNTYFCTSDFLRDHAKYFDDYALRNLFYKWQISHQYLMSHFPRCKIISPRYHSDLPQSSVVLDKNNNVKEYSWHLSCLNPNQNFRLENPAHWICLKAKSKTSKRTL